jgi:hypothetical protein
MNAPIRACILALSVIGAVAACSSPAPSGTMPARSAVARNDICINPKNIRTQTIVSDQEIRIVMNNGDRWVNRLAQRCPSMKFKGFSWDAKASTVCSDQQTIIVNEDGTPCQLGSFEPAPAT